MMTFSTSLMDGHSTLSTEELTLKETVILEFLLFSLYNQNLLLLTWTTALEEELFTAELVIEFDTALAANLSGQYYVDIWSSIHNYLQWFKRVT